MSTILDELYSVPVISDALSDLKASTDNDGISGYNINGSVNKIPGGIINSLIKIFLAEQIGIGVSDQGEIYTEIMGNQRNEILSVLYKPRENILQACFFDKTQPLDRRALPQTSGKYSPYLIIPYLIMQRIKDRHNELKDAWEEIYINAEDSSFRKIGKTKGAGVLIDSVICGSTDEYALSIGDVQNLTVIPDTVYDFTGELLNGKKGTFVLSKGVEKEYDGDPFTLSENKSYSDQMKALKAKAWPLVKDFYEALSEEDKKLVPDEQMLGIYIPTQIFKDIVEIISDGIKNGDMISQNVLLKGPPGVGKSVMAVAIAYVFSMPYRFTQSYKTADASEYIGTTIADNGVLKTNIETQFAQTVMRGGVHMDDDNNYAAEGEGTVKNSVLIKPYTIKLADGSMAKRHPLSIFMMSANPDMKGARPINEAYKDRFGVIVDMKKLAQSEMIVMVKGHSGYNDDDIIVRMIEACEKINDSIAEEGESADMLTPRSLVSWAKQTRIIGDPLKACYYNVLPALCASEEFKENVFNTIIRPLFKRSA